MATRPTNLVLTGFMGTGKTTVGLILAEQLTLEFVDTDRVIVDRHGPVATIFEEHGEAAFRQIEAELAVELASRAGNVISTGGGMLLSAANADALESTGRIYCLTAEPELIVERVTGDESGAVRPLLAGDDPHAKIRSLLAERAASYARFLPVATDGRAPSEVADVIAADWNAPH